MADGMMLSLLGREDAAAALVAGAAASATPISYGDAQQALLNMQRRARHARVPEIPGWEAQESCQVWAWLYSEGCSPENVEAFIWPSTLFHRARASLRAHLREKPPPTSLSAALPWVQRTLQWCALLNACLNIRFPRWTWGYPTSAAEFYGDYDGDRVSGWGFAWSPRARAVLDELTALARRQSGDPAAIVRPWLSPRSTAWDAHTGRPAGIVYMTLLDMVYPRSEADRLQHGIRNIGGTTDRRVADPTTARFQPGDGWTRGGDSSLVQFAGSVWSLSRGAMVDFVWEEGQAYAALEFEPTILRSAQAWLEYFATFDLSSLGLTPEEIAAVHEASARANEELALALLTGAGGLLVAVGGVAGVAAGAILILAALIGELVGWARGTLCPPIPRPLVLRSLSGDCLSVQARDTAIGEPVLGVVDTGRQVGITVLIPPELDRALAPARARRDERNAAAAEADRAKLIPWLIGGLVGVALLLKKKAA